MNYEAADEGAIFVETCDPHPALSQRERVISRRGGQAVAAVYEDSHEPRLKVKDENIGTDSTASYPAAAGSQSRSQIGGLSPFRRLTRQRGRQSELYLPECVPQFGQGRVTESEDVPID